MAAVIPVAVGSRIAQAFVAVENFVSSAENLAAVAAPLAAGLDLVDLVDSLLIINLCLIMPHRHKNCTHKL